jgi:hypothetical protein
MWRPRTWLDLESLVGVADETANLDFKAGLTTSTKELAKDIAAMTVDGGVLLYGVEEDPTTAVATKLAKVPLSGAEERIRQVISSRIAPAPAIEVYYLPENNGDADGVVVVVVPPSSLGPHMVEGRYPRRDGTTTGLLSEPEVARAYARRAVLAELPRASSDLLDDVAQLPGLPPARARSVHAGFGQLQCAIRPANSGAVHPSAPWLGPTLAEAGMSLNAAIEERLRVGLQPALARSLVNWRPAGTTGWTAGNAGGTPEELAERETAAGVLVYPARLTFQVTIPLAVGEHKEPLPYLCAYEGRFAAELWAMLAFAGHFFASADGIGPLHVAVLLAGFNGALAYAATQAIPEAFDHLPQATHGDIAAEVASALELRQTPETLGQRLLDRWLVAFYEGPPLLGRVLKPL